ncbi:MAG: hypothetical protein AAFX99_10145 [Myxococcota bacterium]
MLGEQTFNVNRRAPGAYDADGVWQDGALSALTITGSLQPLSVRERQQFPEGLRTRASYKLFTRSQLQELDSAAGLLPDEVMVGGLGHQVYAVKDFSSAIPGSSLNHYEYLLIAPEVA